MKIKPIKVLRQTNEISLECHEDDKPIFITKNGYNDLVIMSDTCFNNMTSGKNKSRNYINTYKQKENDNKNNFVKVALANIKTVVGDVNHNVEQIIDRIDKSLLRQANICVFSELTLSGYTCRDLFSDSTLIDKVENGLKTIISYSKNKNILIILGAPIKFEGKLYNAVLSIKNGNIISITPISNNKTIDERAFDDYDLQTREINILGCKTYFGKDILLVNNQNSLLRIALGGQNDVSDINSLSTHNSFKSASVIILLAANKRISGTKEKTLNELKAISSLTKTALVCVSAGKGESSTDYVLSGDNLLFENGETLINKDILDSEDIELMDIDLELLNSNDYQGNDVIGFDLNTTYTGLDRQYRRFPFLYEGVDAQNKYLDLIRTQALGLIKRLEASYSKKLVVALSGGLDSTLALLVAKEAFVMSNRDPKDIIAITIPCFGTSRRTHDNALALADLLGVTFKEINIKESVLKHFEDIGHDVNNFNATYENAQARERTQVAMDYANEVGGIMLGTGDLSELCLGWATYNGDHMSMYGVNASIPKTLVQALTKAYGREHSEVKEVLEDIIGTPISPELLPLKDGEIEQKTEDKVGPYELIDFYIYHYLVNHFSLEKISLIAKHAFKDKYDEATINKWLVSFIKRFFASQFKRSCLPDGPQITLASVSPRNGLYMPSDASANTIIEDLKKFTL